MTTSNFECQEDREEFDQEGIAEHRPVIIYNEIISQVSSNKYLGVYTDSTLYWKTHSELQIAANILLSGKIEDFLE